MKARKVLAVLIVMLFAVSSVAFAECSTCGKSTCNPCAKPCNPCAVKPRPCAPCGKVALGYKRDALGNRVPTQTDESGTIHDTATKSENTIVTGE